MTRNELRDIVYPLAKAPLTLVGESFTVVSEEKLSVPAQYRVAGVNEYGYVLKCDYLTKHPWLASDEMEQLAEIYTLLAAAHRKGIR